MLWPEWSESRARANLRYTLAMLRTAIGDRKAASPVLLANPQTIQWDTTSNVWVDVKEFEMCADLAVTKRQDGLSAIECQTLQDVTNLYRGPFLDGFAVADCPEFEAWLLLTRTRLERQMLAVLALLTDHFLAQGLYPAAQQYAQRQIELDPLQEDAYGQLMRILAQMGERTAALALYQQCRQTFAAELEVEPSAEIVRLHRQIQHGELSPTATPRLHPPMHPPMQLATTSLSVHNLPAPTTSFVGRAMEQEAIATLLCREEIRLVTLHGPGGVGKTRLAQEVARQLVAEYADGLYWVDLTPLRRPTELTQALAQTFNVRESASRSLLAVIKLFLRDRHVLLLLDNFEHLLAAAPLVADLLAQAPALNILATSREVLHLYGEQEYPVEPLMTTGWETPSTIITAPSPALQLFTERAQAVSPNFYLNTDNVVTVAQICERLDGLPLALELVAAHLKYLTPQQILAQLQAPQRLEHLVLPTTVRRPARHQTMWDAITWSYLLLLPEAQRIFRWCAVFAGDFTLAALAAILPSHKPEHIQLILFALADKNLVRCAVATPVEVDSDEAHNLELRFTLLATIREFGQAQLIAQDELAKAQRAHTDYYLNLVESIDADALQPLTTHDHQQLTLDYANIRLAMQWVLVAEAYQAGFRLAKGLWRFWTRQMLLTEAYVWLNELLAQAKEEPPSSVYAGTLFIAGVAARYTKEHYGESAHYLEQCLQMSRVLNNKTQTGLALAFLSAAAFDRGDFDEAQRCDEESLQLRRELGINWQLAMMLANLGHREAKLGNFGAARAYLEEGRLYQEQGKESYGIAITHMWLGMLARLEGDWAQAKVHLAESQKLCAQTNLPSVSAYTHGELGQLQLAAGNHGAARSSLDKALNELDTTNNRSAMASSFCALIDLLATAGIATDALKVAAFLTQFLNELGTVLPPVDTEQFEQAITLARKELTPQAAATAWAKGEAMTLEEAVTAVIHQAL